jgi:hypothetical protein
MPPLPPRKRLPANRNFSVPTECGLGSRATNFGLRTTASPLRGEFEASWAARPTKRIVDRGELALRDRGWLKTILANPVMINAYRSGIPGSGRLFPEGSKIAKFKWSKRTNPASPYAVTEPDTPKSVAFIERIPKGSRRQADGATPSSPLTERRKLSREKRQRFDPLGRPPRRSQSSSQSPGTPLDAARASVWNPPDGRPAPPSRHDLVADH